MPEGPSGAADPEGRAALERAGEFEYHSSELDLTGDPDDQRWSIRCLDVHKRLGGVPVLNGLNLAIPDETVTVVLGPSGTGKSTLIKHVIGLMFPDSGDIVVRGQSVPSLTMPQLLALRRRIGVLFQDGALFGSMNVFDNVAFPLRHHTDKGEDEIQDIVGRRLAEVGLTNAGGRMPNELSGGMRKRAGFARALVLDPDIVLFDEPDSGLDPVRTALLGELIQEIHHDMMEDFQRREKAHMPAFCLITHDIMTARRVAEHISVLWKGRIVESGPADELFDSRNEFVRQFLAGESHGPLGME